MHKVITHEACRIPVGQRHADGYLNVTVMCKVVGEVALPQPQEKKATPWTPPPLYPDMKEETFKALPYHEQVILMETAEARDERRRREGEEIKNWKLRYCYY